jgi:hypothetical protein
MPALSFTIRTDPETVDRVMIALAGEPRRIVLAYFEESADETASVDDLVEYIVTHQSYPSTRCEVRQELHHIHLAKLAAEDLVDYDSQTGTVRRSESTTTVEGTEQRDLTVDVEMVS